MAPLVSRRLTAATLVDFPHLYMFVVQTRDQLPTEPFMHGNFYLMRRQCAVVIQISLDTNALRPTAQILPKYFFMKFVSEIPSGGVEVSDHVPAGDVQLIYPPFGAHALVHIVTVPDFLVWVFQDDQLPIVAGATRRNPKVVIFGHNRFGQFCKRLKRQSTLVHVRRLERVTLAPGEYFQILPSPASTREISTLPPEMNCGQNTARAGAQGGLKRKPLAAARL